MDRDSWKVNKVSDIIGLSKYSVNFLHPTALVTLKERLSAVDTIGAVILYGSVARGDASSKSDIDLMVILLDNENRDQMEQSLKDILHGIEQEFKLSIGFSYSIFEGSEDPYFLWETLKDGVVIFCRAEALIPSITGIKPYALLSYSLSGLDDGGRKRIHRFLFESEMGAHIDRSNKMEYIAPGVILLPLSRVEQVINCFQDNNVNYSLMKIWR